MTDVPSLPPPPSALPPPGWYADPSTTPGYRWWDGNRWTEFAQGEHPVDPAAQASRQINGRRRILASWWRRGGAFLIDYVVVLVPSLLTQALLGVILHQAVFPKNGFGQEPGGDVATRLIASLIVGMLGLAYGGVFFRKYGATIGMQAVGVEAVDQQTGERLSVAQCWRRIVTVFLLIGIWGQAGFLCRALNDNPNRSVAAANILVAVSLAGSFLTFLWAAGNANNQTLQDKAAGAIVVLAEKDQPVP